MGYVLGIDVGTTFTAAAVWRAGQGRPEAVELGDQATAIPSVLLVRSDGALLVGDAANRRALTEPGRVAREFKRRVGDRVPLVVGGEAFLPHTLVAMLLRRVIDQVAEREGERPTRVVVTCPANWGEYRRQLLTDAAAEAGAGDVGLVSEPVAAAVWYASQERLADGALVAVYDLGGGTFDAAVLRKAGDGFELLGEPAGDDSLGGIDFDQVVMEHVAATIGPAWSALDLSQPTTLRAVAQVLAHAVAAKEALSSDLEVEIPVIVPGVSRDVRLTRAEFEDGIREQLGRTVATLRRALSDAHVRPPDLHAVLLVGGSSRIPLVSGLIAEVGAPVAVDTHPKLAVALGAATVAAPRRALAPVPVPPVPVPAPTEGQEPETAAAEPVAEGGGAEPEAGTGDEGEPWAAPEEAGQAATVVVGPRLAPPGTRRIGRKPPRRRTGVLAAVAAVLFAAAVIVPLTMTRGAIPAAVGPGDGTEPAGSSVGGVADTTVLAGGTPTTLASATSTTADVTQVGGGAGATSTTRRRTTTTRRHGGGGGPTTSQPGGGAAGTTSPTTEPQTTGPPTFGLTVIMTRTDLPVRITSEPDGIDCPDFTCSARFPPGTRIVLRPNVGFGVSVRMFGGPCGGRIGACALTLNSSLTIRVQPFEEIG